MNKLPRAIVSRRRKLIEALRSGKYNKGVGALEYNNDRGKHCFCVFGVAREVWKKQRDKTTFWSHDYDRNKSTKIELDSDTVKESIVQAYGSVPYELQQYFGFNEFDGICADDLVQWNDNDKKSFKWIAKQLEKDLTERGQ